MKLRAPISLALMLVLPQVLSLLPRTTSGQNIDLGDRQIIFDWIDQFRRIDPAYTIDRNTTACGEVIKVYFNGAFGPVVTCNAEGRVTNLILGAVASASEDVDQNPMAGTTIPRSIGNLTSLVELRLSKLGLRGTIPPEIFLLPNLTVFHAPSNRLWGSIPATVRNATKLTTFVVVSNLLSGIIPDLRPLTSLDTLRLDSNNFKCPQPFILPSILNSMNFPSMSRARCSSGINRLSTNGDPFSLCGVDLTTAGATLCSYYPIIYDNMTTDLNSGIVIGPNNSVVQIRLDRFRHAFFFPRNPLSSGFFLDTIGVSTFATSRRDRKNQHAHYPFRGYTSVVRDASDPNIWRLSAPLNGTRNILETVWEFRPPSEVKYSYILRDWDWAAPDHNAVQLNLQTAIIGDFFRLNQQDGFCYLPRTNDSMIMIGSTPEPIVECLSGSEYMNVTISNFQVTINQSAAFGGIVVDFPIVYQYDTTNVDAFTINDASAYLHPFGRTISLNYVNSSDSPIPTYLAENSVSDPSMVGQSIIFSMGLEMKRFNDSLYYDPTIMLSVAFSDQPPSSASLSPQTADLIQSINYGMILGILFAAIAVVAVGLVFIFVPAVRRAVQPYFGFRKLNGPLDDSDISPSYPREATPSTSAPAAASSSSAASQKGWKTAKPVA